MKESYLKCIGCETIYDLSCNKAVYGCMKRNGNKVNHIIEKFTDSKGLLPDLKEIQKRKLRIDNPFIVFKEFFFVYYLAKHLNINYEEIINNIDASLKEIGEPCFIETPMLTLSESKLLKLYIKNETGNVTGSHKARHLMGNILYFEILIKAGIMKNKPKLAVYSCGNAALAAAAVARAADYQLDVFIPPNVNKNITSTLIKHKANIVVCPRVEGESGDPCYNRFQEALANGAAPFSCSGPDNWSNIEGGQTLCLEFITRLLSLNVNLDSVVIQVGGGALASSAIKTLEELYSYKYIGKLPKIYTVQTEGAFPLARAYYILLKEIAVKNKLNCSADFSYNPGNDHIKENDKIFFYSKSKQNEILLINEFIKRNYYSSDVQKILIKANQNMNQYMWSWEKEPHSIAHGILDDITYDWFKIIEGMFKTGGVPVIVSEECLKETNAIALDQIKIKTDHTGTSGFAGYRELFKLGYISEEKSVGLFFTGTIR